MEYEIFKPATPKEIIERTEAFEKIISPDKSCREIAECREDLLTEKNLENVLFYPAGGTDFKVVEEYGDETNIFIYVDVCLKKFFNFYCGRVEFGLDIDKQKLVTLQQVLQIDDYPKTTIIDKRIAEVYKKYSFADGHLRTEAERTPVGLFDIKTKHGTKRLFYIVNEGYWTYLILFAMGHIAPKILYMSKDMVATISGIPAFESKDGIRKLFKAKPGRIDER